MRELIETGLSPLISDKKKTVTLKDLSLQDPTLVIENIRCYGDWTVNKREDHVLLYKTFSEWLSKETFGYVLEACDLDRHLVQKRQIPFETYIEILSHMDLREQILAKMFYLGGNRALEEVLSVKIEDIDFPRSLIHFSDDVSYPWYLFEDIKKYIQSRKKGYVFAGREQERVSTSTPFRSLKKIASELHLDPEFTFKDFTKNV
jgi:integrase